MGTRQHALTILGHDAAHRLITHKLWLNDLLGNVLCFWPLTLSLYGYRRLHFGHHRFLKTSDDPERPFTELVHFSLPASRARLVLLFFKDLFGFGLMDVPLFIKSLKADRLLDNLLPIVFVLALSLILVCLLPLQVVVIWLLAIPTSQFAISRLRSWTEHTGISGTHKFSVGFFMRLLAFPHNTWCHFEHHVYPLVPFHSLPLLRQKLGAADADVFAVFSKFESYDDHGFTMSKP